MVYVPDANDASRPLITDPAYTAAEEFRKLKEKVNTLAVAGGTRSAVRQTVLAGMTTAGLASFLSTPTTPGLKAKLLATGSPIYLSWAAGFDNAGDVNLIQALSADVEDYWTGLIPSITNFLYLDYVDGVANPTAGTLRQQPQYRMTFDRTANAVVTLDGVPNATTMLDEMGNTWTRQGGAKLESTIVKYGTTALGGAGGANALDGAADYLKSANFTYLGRNANGWRLAAWVQPTALPTAGQKHRIISAVNAAGFGAELTIYNNGGTIKFSYELSSDGTSANVATGTQGTTTPVVSTWYYVELTYDILAGVYRLYVNGAQEASTASALRVGAITGMALGASLAGTANTFLFGYISDFVYRSNCRFGAGTAYVTPTNLSQNVTTIVDWFDLNAMVMKKITTASAAAGVDPTFTAVNRLYVGEADCDAATCTAVRSYAIQGKVIGDWTAIPGASTAMTLTHNIGTELVDAVLELKNLTADIGYLPDDIVTPQNTNAGNAPIPLTKRRNSIVSVTGGAANGFILTNLSSGAAPAPTVTLWQFRIKAKRAF